MYTEKQTALISTSNRQEHWCGWVCAYYQWLRGIRIAYGCSQSELARKSGVSVRSIQMYEQRRKDINRCQLASVISLARVLGCRAEDLAEC